MNSNNQTTNVNAAHDLRNQDTITISSDANDAPNQQVNVNFGDMASEPVYTYMDRDLDNMIGDHIPDVALSTFLSRPVLISSLSWTVGTPFSTTDLRPWDLYLSAVPIKKKIDNFAFIKGDLHLKIMVNASPFFYGSLLAFYNPVPHLSMYPPVSTPLTSSNPEDLQLIWGSQRPHLWVLPQSNQAGELVLPFFWPANWLPIKLDDSAENMGLLRIIEAVALQSANGATGSVDIQVFAWMENVKLNGPTLDLAMQSSGLTTSLDYVRNVTDTVGNIAQSMNGAIDRAAPTLKDEYATGPVSKLASSVARGAQYFSRIPVIGRFAKATQFGASVVGKIASIFGFTNVPVIDDVKPMLNVPFHALASSEIGQPIEKLTLDPKNELSIDPKCVDLSSVDELAITEFCSHESYYATAYWDVADATNTVLMSTAVSPLCQRRAELNPSYPTYFAVGMTPMAHVSQLFACWRGDIEFRFKAICSQYHRGRLRISWDPTGDLAATADTSTVAFTRIVDLTPDMDFRLRIPFAQAVQFLKTREMNSSSGTGVPSEVMQVYRSAGGVGSAPIVQGTDGSDNGTLTIRVLNELSSPTTTGQVAIQVFVKGSDNLAFANPLRSLSYSSGVTSWLELQSGKFTTKTLEAPTAKPLVASQDTYEDPNQYEVYMGERIYSLRTLLRRTENVDILTFQTRTVTNTNVDRIDIISMNKIPNPYGFLSGSVFQANKQLSAGFGNYSWVKRTHMELLMPCFAGWKGSVNWIINPDTYGSSSEVNTIRFSRRKGATPTLYAATTVASGSISQYMASYVGTTISGMTGGGAMISQLNLSALQVQCPHYSRFKWCGTLPTLLPAGSSNDGTDEDHYALEIYTKPSSLNDGVKPIRLHRFCSAGPDFSLYFFIGIPFVYKFPAVPTPTPP